MDSLEFALRIRVECLGMARSARDVNLDGRQQSLLAQLPKDGRLKFRHIEWCRAQSNKGFPPGLAEPFAGCPGDPLREHGERPAGSLIMWHALPLPLEDGNRCGIERVGNLKPRLQGFSSLGVGCDGVYSRPFRRQLRPPLEAPLRVSLGHRLPGAFLSQVFKKPASYDFAELAFAVGNHIFCHALYDLAYWSQTLSIKFGHCR